MGGIGIVAFLIVALVIAALIKYVFFRWDVRSRRVTQC